MGLYVHMYKEDLSTAITQYIFTTYLFLTYDKMEHSTFGSSTQAHSKSNKNIPNLSFNFDVNFIKKNFNYLLN